MTESISTWPEISDFYRAILSLHDSTILKISQHADRCDLVLHDAYSFTEDRGFYVAYSNVVVRMFGVILATNCDLQDFMGYDIVDSELSPDSLWISTIIGAISFEFRGISFNFSRCEGT